VRLYQQRQLSRTEPGQIETACIFTGRTETIACQSIVMITERIPERGLFDELIQQKQHGQLDGIQAIRLIGDALAPGTIAAAVYGGHRCAREFGQETDFDRPPFKRELPWYHQS